MLRHGDGHATEPVGPFDHLERRCVAVGHGHAAKVRIAEIEAQAEEHRQTVPLDVAPTEMWFSSFAYGNLVWPGIDHHRRA